MGNGELNAVELEKEAVAPCIFLDGVLLARKISQKGDGVLPDSKIFAIRPEGVFLSVAHFRGHFVAKERVEWQG